jgi:hypothetical protein
MISWVEVSFILLEKRSEKKSSTYHVKYDPKRHESITSQGSKTRTAPTCYNLVGIKQLASRKL